MTEMSVNVLLHTVRKCWQNIEFVPLKFLSEIRALLDFLNNL